MSSRRGDQDQSVGALSDLKEEIYGGFVVPSRPTMITTPNLLTKRRDRRPLFVGACTSHAFSVVCAICTICGFIPGGPVATAHPPTLAATSHPHPITADAYLGSLSCSAANCHGDPHRTTVIGSAAQYFLDCDKHQLAGTVLYGERSRSIRDRLKLPHAAWESRECLTCHAPAAIGATDPSTMVADGVSCESCHGPARQWLSSHRSADWKRNEFWTSSRKSDAGFRNSKDLVTRANLCADCHVGNADQSVNHDMIAAGHPRLNFEFAACQARMPLHWCQTDHRHHGEVPNASQSAVRLTEDARNWVIGQLVTAEHELQILSAAARNSSATWPELSQYDCFACHHDVSSPGWRQSRTAWNLQPGEFQWGTWGLGLLADAQPRLSTVLNDEFVADQNALRCLMKSMRADRSQALTLADRQQQQIRQVQAGLQSMEFSCDEVAGIRDALLQQSQKFTNQGWDRSTQLFLAIVALDNGGNAATGNPVDVARIESLVRLREWLSYRGGRPACKSFPYRESPVRFDANRRTILEEFRRLQSPVDPGREVPPEPVTLEND